MRQRSRAAVRALVTWTPLNHALTGLLRSTLPARARRHPALARYLPRAGVVQAQLPGGGMLRMYSRGDDDIAGPLFWRGWAGHEPETVKPFHELAESARVTLDIGAHVGYFALVASYANPAGHVYAFEPLVRVRERLERNVTLNGATNVTCVPLAVGSPSGTAQFFHVRGGIPSSSSLSQGFMQAVVAREELTSTSVEVVEVDDFVQSRGLTGRIDLIKVDTETTEAAVIRGMLRTLRSDRPDIVCEVLDASVAETIEALLQPLGYEFFLLTVAGAVRCDRIRPDAVWRNYILRARDRERVR